MKNILLILSLWLVSNLAHAVCSSPISRTPFVSYEKLSSSKLNSDFNAAYTKINDLPGDCVTDSTITSAKITDATIVNADISTLAGISRSKLSSTVNYAISSSSSSFTTSSASYVDVTNLSVSITTTGAPVEAYLTTDGAASSQIGFLLNGTSGFSELKLVRGATDIGKQLFAASGATAATFGVTVPPSSFKYFDTPAAGTYTYKIQGLVSGGTLSVTGVKLIVKEL